jgi:signal peptidase I
LKSLSQNSNRSAVNEERQLSVLSAIEAAVLFEDILARNLSLRVKATGKSMAPFLNGGEFLTIKKVSSSSLRTGNLIFFKTRHGLPVLHRIVKKERLKDRFVFHTKGDALIAIDEPVPEDSILGKVCRIEKKHAPGKTKLIDLESPYRRIINYLLAKKSLMKSKAYLSIQQCAFYPSLRSIVKKTLF